MAPRAFDIETNEIQRGAKLNKRKIGPVEREKKKKYFSK